MIRSGLGRNHGMSIMEGYNSEIFDMLKLKWLICKLWGHWWWYECCQVCAHVGGHRSRSRITSSRRKRNDYVCVLRVLY
jgi:hypothetical protein